MIAETIRESWRTKERQEMSTSSNSMKVDNVNCQLPSLITFQLDGPHPCVRVRCLVMNKPVDQNTRKLLSMKLKGEEKQNTPNFHPFHPFFQVINNHENSMPASVRRSSSVDWKKDRNWTESNCKRLDHQLQLHKFWNFSVASCEVCWKIKKLKKTGLDQLQLVFRPVMCWTLLTHIFT